MTLAFGQGGGLMSGGVSTWKGIFVFSATIIGAGILALPIAGAVAGLMPTILILLLIGAVSVFSALYIAEAVLNTEGGHHLPTLAQVHLGRLPVCSPWTHLAIDGLRAAAASLACEAQALEDPQLAELFLKTLNRKESNS